MSFARFVYYTALAGGWGAFFGWLVIERNFFAAETSPTGWSYPLIGGILGAAISGGVSLAGAMTNGQWLQVTQRVLIGAIGGAVGGAIGMPVAQACFQMFPQYRFLAWILIGPGVGLVEGLYERSPQKLRNGLIGGVLGGLLGGLLFDPIYAMVGSGTSSRAVGFVILGLCIGAFIGLVQVLLKEAWLTVIEGYRPGRQLILATPEIRLGRADHLPLPFLGLSNANIEREHVRITRQANGMYLVADNQSKQGTHLNGQPLQQPALLKDGDCIKFGPNYVKFNERRRSASSTVAQTTSSSPPPVPLPPPRPGGAAPSPTSGVLPPPPRGANPRTPPVPPAGSSKPTSAPVPTATRTTGPALPSPSKAPPPPPPKRG